MFGSCLERITPLRTTVCVNGSCKVLELAQTDARVYRQVSAQS